MTTFLRRAVGALLLERETYEEVEADGSATVQAFIVVLISAVAGGIGARGFGGTVAQLPAYIVIALLGWGLWALLIYQVGAKWLPGPETQADVGQLLRTIGFAAAPGTLRVFAIVPALSTPVFAITAVWMLLAMIVAVRQALDYATTARAVFVCAIGWVLTVVMVALLSMWATPSLA